MGLEEVFLRLRAPIFSFGSSSAAAASSGSPGREINSSSNNKGKKATSPPPTPAAGAADPGSKQAEDAAAPTTAGPRSPVTAPGAAQSMESSFVLVGYPAQQQAGPEAEAAAAAAATQSTEPSTTGKDADPAVTSARAAAEHEGSVGPSSSAQERGGEGEEKSGSDSDAASVATTTATTITTTAPSSPGTPAVMVRRIPVLPEWRERLPLVMVQSRPDGSNTPIGIIKDLSGAVSIEAAGGNDGEEQVIEIRAQEWQQLKEAEALLRLTFRDYDGVSVWWFYTIPTFVSCIISGTTGTEVPELSNPAVGLKCSIAPYDENSTRRAFFLTCPEWDPLNAAYQRIRKGWNYWRYQSLEKQIDRALGVLYGVSIAPIKADGNCLFRAFARAILGDEERHPETRAAIVAFMRASEELRLFIVSDDEAEDSGAFAERYLDEMGKPGTWGDQVEITAFTRVYGRSVRVFSYNYTENRLLSVGTPIEEGGEAKGPEVWLLHLHGHYSLLAPGVAPNDEGWQRLLREFEEEKGEQPTAAEGSTAKAPPGREQLQQQEHKEVPQQVAAQEEQQQRPATPVEGAASLVAAMAVVAEQEESKQAQEGQDGVLLRACSTTTVTETATATAAMAVDGSVVLVECVSSSTSVMSTSEQIVTAGAVLPPAEGE